MRLAVCYPEHLAQPAARRIQVAATLRALAGRGARIHFVVGRFAGLQACLTELGLAGVGGLIPEPVAMLQKGPGSRPPFSWHGVYHRACLVRLRRLAGSGLSWILVRHLKLADYLLPRLGASGPRLCFEAHELFSQTAAEEGAAPAKVAKLAAMESRVFGGAHCLAAISRPLAEELARRPEVRGPVALAPSGVEESFFAVGDQARQPDLVAYAGGLGPWKGVDLLLRALALVPEARLEVLGGQPGSSDWRRLTALAAELNLGARLVLRPKADQAAVRELLGRARLAVWPGSGGQRIAAEFTSPLKLFEYLAAGCAVLAPDLPAARAVLTHQRDAWLFRADDPQALAQGLERLLRDPVLAQGLARAGRDLARGYTWEARAGALLAAMEAAA
ncbi:MAG: glycosyltransferase [Desulfarculus sp.]|nr:glycosyltransferase [Desulfarculus sp.]